MSSKINDQSFQFGCLEIASLRELRDRIAKVENGAGKPRMAELVGEAKASHADPANAGAVRSDVRPYAQWTDSCLRWIVDQKLVSRAPQNVPTERDTICI